MRRISLYSSLYKDQSSRMMTHWLMQSKIVIVIDITFESRESEKGKIYFSGDRYIL